MRKSTKYAYFLINIKYNKRKGGILINTVLRDLFSHLVSIDGMLITHQLRRLDALHPQGWRYQEVIDWIMPEYLSKELPGLAAFLRDDLMDPSVYPQPAQGCLAKTEGDLHATALLLTHILPFVIFGVGKFYNTQEEGDDLFDAREEEVDTPWMPSRRDIAILSPHLRAYPLAHDCDDSTCRQCHREKRMMYRNLIIHCIWTKFFCDTATIC